MSIGKQLPVFVVGMLVVLTVAFTVACGAAAPDGDLRPASERATPAVDVPSVNEQATPAVYGPSVSEEAMLAVGSTATPAAGSVALDGEMATPAVDGDVRSGSERATPSVDASDVDDLSRGNRVFAFDLYQALRNGDGNLFYSPYSISLALAMTYAGAGGDTEVQMGDVLRFALPQDRLHPAFNALDLELAARGGDGDGFGLNIANGIWGQRGYEFQEPFLDVLAESYGAGVRPVNFQADPEQARVEINDWVADATDDRVRDLLPPDVVTTLTRMVLANAIHFKETWSHPFDAAATRDAPFHLLGGGSVDVPMMRTDADFGYVAGDGYQAVDLPYDGHELSMTVLLPDRERFREFEDALDSVLVDRIIADLAVGYVDLELPKFEFESRFRLAGTLQAMGMPDAFDRSVADFSRMDGRSCRQGDARCLYIGDVLHRAFVSVDEEGTEAAAATAVVMNSKSMPPEPVRVTVDRPFVFLIRDQETGSILFTGRFVEP